MSKVNEIIKLLELEPLEREGGLFKSTYRSPGKADGKDMGSAIFFMLTGGAYSHLHRLPTDEVYHFYSGDPVELLELLPDGSSNRVVLGGDILNGQKVQYVVKAGIWQGSRLIDGGEYALMGTTMSPGFEESDYEHADNPKELIEKYPEKEDLIMKLVGETKYY
ncbi:cupin domain-containing protein [Tissierella sp.]|uniref:cupin domain-containing protein n=1 Tax=Tissierella sp. TaxID=41274 RepID=UPI0028B0AC2F|nr:cupin domain-containing protein [Tissierella sp.]